MHMMSTHICCGMVMNNTSRRTSVTEEEMHRRFENAPDSAKTKALQTVIEMKDSKISSMERGLRDLEEEIQMLKSNGALSTEEREEEIKQMEVYRSHSKFMKNKIGQVKQELSRKDTELLALQTKLETLTNQFSDSKQHIEVLKESLTAKEQRAAILQTEVDALRLRLEEKETMLNKKTKQIQEIAEEKGTQAGEIHDLKDMLDVKERKVNVLQKKIENLQEQLRDKEKQMSSLKDRVKSLQADTTNTDTALTTLEEALAEKERTIERLKEQRDRDEREKQEETDNYKKDLKDLKEKVSLLQGDLSEKEASLLDLKEHASSLASSGLKKDSRLKTLEIALEQKKEECLKMETQLKKHPEVLLSHPSKPAHEATLEAKTSPELNDRFQQLEREVALYQEETSKAQAEVDRLLEILKEMENEKNDKDKKIAELERGKSCFFCIYPALLFGCWMKWYKVIIHLLIPGGPEGWGDWCQWSSTMTQGIQSGSVPTIDSWELLGTLTPSSSLDTGGFSGGKGPHVTPGGTHPHLETPCLQNRCLLKREVLNGASLVGFDPVIVPIPSPVAGSVALISSIMGPVTGFPVTSPLAPLPIATPYVSGTTAVVTDSSPPVLSVALFSVSTSQLAGDDKAVMGPANMLPPDDFQAHQEFLK
ncbi:ELKS/Rab6-interacting/CAST family member 1 [Chelonia mydas]|uniref:ELKS/Rab6-interacting/CAST family member 1 n=1 Tax=Chelonia mydas TaxID=8469 RepID=M7ALN6_CHEMY|nr:ELKS/Rab6-interacting/CAST family member 1 [Chelonia mydas]